MHTQQMNAGEYLAHVHHPDLQPQSTNEGPQPETSFYYPSHTEYTSAITHYDPQQQQQQHSSSSPHPHSHHSTPCTGYGSCAQCSRNSDQIKSSFPALGTASAASLYQRCYWYSLSFPFLCFSFAFPLLPPSFSFHIRFFFLLFHPTNGKELRMRSLLFLCSWPQQGSSLLVILYKLKKRSCELTPNSYVLPTRSHIPRHTTPTNTASSTTDALTYYNLHYAEGRLFFFVFRYLLFVCSLLFPFLSVSFPFLLLLLFTIRVTFLSFLE